MANRRVNGSKRAPWIGWILGLLVIVALIFVVREIFDSGSEVEMDRAESTQPADPQSEQAAGPISDIVANPNAYVNRDFPSTEVNVAAVPTDGSFWIADGSDSLFAAIVQIPAEQQPLDIRAGRRIHIDGGTLRDSLFFQGGSGLALDSAAQEIARSLPITLTVDPRDISFPDAPADATQASR